MFFDDSGHVPSRHERMTAHVGDGFIGQAGNGLFARQLVFPPFGNAGLVNERTVGKPYFRRRKGVVGRELVAKRQAANIAKTMMMAASRALENGFIAFP